MASDDGDANLNLNRIVVVAVAVVDDVVVDRIEPWSVSKRTSLSYGDDPVTLNYKVNLLGRRVYIRSHWSVSLFQ